MEGHSLPSGPAAGALALPRTAPPADPPSALAAVRALVLPAARRRLLRALVVVGAAVTVVGWVVARERTCGAILLGSHYVLGLGLGALLFLAFGYVTQAGWMAAFRRVPEAMAGTLTVGAAATVLALACVPWLYEWAHADAVAHDALLQQKTWWLDAGGFVARGMLALLVWLAFAWALRRNSRLQDATGDLVFTRRNGVLSAAFLVVFALTFSMASFDWIMSLEPHWYSTVFAVYDFAGMFVSALAAMTLILVALRRAGHLRGVLRDDHLHDVAKLTFGFATFWGYIWFCQFMLIWYAHIPEETAYYAVRQQGAWGVLSIVNPIVNWLVPFLVLLPRAAKRRESTLLKVCALLLVGRWLDLQLMIQPSFSPDGPQIGPWEAGPLLVALPLFVLVCHRILARGRLVPTRDPMLGESLHHHV